MSGSTVTLGAFAPLAAYTLSRQAQVFVERFLGSTLPPGTISHLNYAQKVAQMPMLVALLVCTVTFPTLARNVAAGEAEAARRRLEADLRTVTALILLAAAYLIAFAPQLVALLLQHGEFTAADTAATAAVMRVYALGLTGHALVGVLSRAFFTGEQRLLVPGRGDGHRARGDRASSPSSRCRRWHAYAIAAANGAGITTTAVLLLAGLRTHRRGATARPTRAGGRAAPGASALPTRTCGGAATCVAAGDRRRDRPARPRGGRRRTGRLAGRALAPGRLAGLRRGPRRWRRRAGRVPGLRRVRPAGRRRRDRRADRWPA